MADKERGEAVAAERWRVALSCGDMLDRFPCARCGAISPKGCEKPLTASEIEATRDFINGYGWAAARRLAEAGDRA